MVLFPAPFAAAEQGGRYWVPTTTNPTTYHPRIATKATTTHKATTQKGERSPLAANARLARTATVSSAVGGAIAAGLLHVAGPEWVLRSAAVGEKATSEKPARLK